MNRLLKPLAVALALVMVMVILPVSAKADTSLSISNVTALEHPGMAEGWDRGVGYLKKPFEIVNSFIDVPTAPGLGIEVDEDYVRSHTFNGDWDTPRLFHTDGSVAQW